MSPLIYFKDFPIRSLSDLKLAINESPNRQNILDLGSEETAPLKLSNLSLDMSRPHIISSTVTYEFFKIGYTDINDNITASFKGASSRRASPSSDIINKSNNSPTLTINQPQTNNPKPAD